MIKTILLIFAITSSSAFAQGYIKQLTVGNLNLNVNTLSTTNTNGDLTVSPNGTGSVLLPYLTPSTVVVTDGSKKLISSATTAAQLGQLATLGSALCGISDVCTLTNKTISGSANTITNLNASNITTGSLSTARLTALGSANQLFGVNAAGTAFEAKAATLTAAGSLTIPASQSISVPDGTAAAPSLMYTSETNTGWYRNGAANPSLSITGTQSFDINKVSATQINFGFGQAASAVASNPLSASTTYNGTANFNYSNLSAGAASNTTFYIGNGPGGGNGITVENQAYASTAYTGGGGVLSAGPNLTQLVIASETTSSPTIRFAVGGRIASKEAMVLSPASLTINKGTNLVMSGATSGALTINAGAATTSYGITMPTAQGGTGTVLTNSDGAGTMTWGSTLSNPMTTFGDIIYENNSPAPARLAGNITTTLKYLTQTGTGAASAAPVWNAHTAGSVSIVTPTSHSGGFSANSSGTYTVPAGALYIKVTAIGGGGGGGGSAGGSAAGAAAGGGGAGTAIKYISAPLATYAYAVGAAGVTGGAGNTNGGVGGNSTFGSSFLTANGGGVGGGSGAGSSGPVFSTGSVAGGTASGGDLNITGGYGWAGTILAASQAFGGRGGEVQGYGVGGLGGQGTQGGGAPPSGYGSGGGGAAVVNAGAAQAGGAGAAGIIVVEEFYQ